MRYAIVRYGSDEPIVYSEITTLSELADALDKPELGDDCEPWIEGLGSPTCIYDCEQWRMLARFIREKVIPMESRTRPATATGGGA
jgi:hypothetical protein